MKKFRLFKSKNDEVDDDPSSISSLIFSGKSIPKKEVKILTAKEANEITLINEPRFAQKEKDFEDWLLKDLMKNINEMAENGERRAIGLLDTPKQVIQKLQELGYTVEKSKSDKPHVRSITTITW
jgi:hypothetical protein